MRFWKSVSLYMSAGAATVVGLLLTTAWFQIQAVRWAYRAQTLRLQMDELAKKEQSLDLRLQQNLSLSRLDELAKGRFGLRVPSPTQIVLLTDPKP